MARLTSSTQIGLPRLAELALPTLYPRTPSLISPPDPPTVLPKLNTKIKRTSRVKRDHVIPYFDILHTFSDGFDDSASFVAEDGGEGAFWVFTGEGVGVAMGSEWGGRGRCREERGRGMRRERRRRGEC